MSIPPDNTRWTGEKAAMFLKALARTGKVAPAARAVGMSRQAAYRLRARAPKFAELWLTAMEAARQQQLAQAGAGGRRPVHPLLDKGPVLAREVTHPARHGDTSARHASHFTRPGSHRMRTE